MSKWYTSSFNRLGSKVVAERVPDRRPSTWQCKWNHVDIIAVLVDAEVVDTGIALHRACLLGSEASAKLLVQQRQKVWGGERLQRSLRGERHLSFWVHALGFQLWWPCMFAQNCVAAR